MKKFRRIKELKLVKDSKKGLLRIIFGRTGINVILILLQTSILLSMFVFFYDAMPEYLGVNLALRAIFIFVVLGNSDSTSVKMTWVAMFAILPIYSAGMYLLVKNDVGHRMLKKASITVTEATKGVLVKDSDALKRLKHNSTHTCNLLKYIERTGTFPVYRHTAVKYYKLGDDMLPDILTAVEHAKHFIFIEYFIIEEGHMWGQILNLLAKKAKEGVEVRVLYDGMCEFAKLPHNYPNLLAKIGIDCRIFDKIMPFISTTYNYRDHRKFFIVDGTIGFTGGVNLADEYINNGSKFGHWKDTGVRLYGDAVKTMTLMMLQDWALADPITRHRGKRLSALEMDKSDILNLKNECKKYTERIVFEKQISDGYIIPFGDNPLDDERVGEAVYMDIINRAESYVYIMTPYLILDEEMQNTLKSAAKKGISVKIIIPHIPDKKIVFALTRSYCKPLIEAGVEIYEYTPGFVHAKVFLSDNKRAVVGSINLDYRSLYHNFEDAVYMEDSQVLSDIKEDFIDTFKRCHRVTKKDLKNQRLSQRFVGTVFKIFDYLV